MYLQVTNRCNMACRHCMFDCKRQGEDLPVHQVYHATLLAQQYDHYITIGGGEPTMHPRLIDIIDTIHEAWPQQMFMVTNGTCTKRKWFQLLDRVAENMVDLRVSWDPWHNKGLIQPWVSSWASSKHRWWGDTTVVERRIHLRGRAVRYRARIEKDGLDFGYPGVTFSNDSDCLWPRIAPDGTIFADMEEPVRVGWLGHDAYDEACRLLEAYRERIEDE